MNIPNSEKQVNTKIIKAYTWQYGVFSAMVHLAFLAAILYSSTLFMSNNIIVEEGGSAIKAVMIDLQVAAPKQLLVEDVPEIQGDKTPEDEKEKPEEDSKVQLVQPPPPPESIKPAEKIKKEKPKPKPTQKAVRQQVRQEVDSKNIAKQATAPSISDHQQYADHPSAISRNRPQYPRRALDMRIEGYVIVKFDVNSEGETDNIRIVESVPSNIFDREVVKAIKKWQYQPVAAKDLQIKIVFNQDSSISLDNE